MPFVEVNIQNEIEKQRQNNPEFRKAWDESRAEYKLIGEMISLRKQENITQKELASLTGNKQQVISRIERKESIPTIRAFSHMLEVDRHHDGIAEREKHAFCPAEGEADNHQQIDRQNPFSRQKILE